jgi:putative transposase
VGGSAVVVQAYRFGLDPSPGAERALARHAGAARFAFNWGLALVRACLAQRDAERSYGVAEQSLTPVPWTLFELRRRWNQAKDQAAPWWAECSKEAYNSGLDALARGLRGFAESRAGRRAGRRVGFPRFKSRRRSRAAFRFTTGAIRVEADRKHVRLPRLGTIKLCESARKLARRIEAGTARILSASVSKDSDGRWQVAFTCQVARTVGRPAHARRLGAVVGVDAGVRALAVLSAPVPGLTDEQGRVANPRRLAGMARPLARAQRQAARRAGPRDPATGARRVPSRRWEQAQRRVARLHARARHARADGWHKLTTALAQGFDTVVVEDLNLAGMTARPAPRPGRGGRYARNGRAAKRGLARALADAAPAQLRRLLTYKTTWYGSRLHVASRFYPSSKTCSGCQAVRPKLPLSEPTFTCGNCGLRLDRDVNAARNLAHLAAGTVPTAPTVPGVPREPEPTTARTRVETRQAPRRPVGAGTGQRNAKPAPPPWVRRAAFDRKAEVPQTPTH